MINKFPICVPKHHISVVVFSSRSYCQEIKIIKTPDVSRLKRGTGGRSSFNGNVVTVFGATGFMGRRICNQLGKRGAQIIIPHRSEPDDLRVKNLKLCGDLGQVLFQPFNLTDPLSIRKAVKYSNVVINLIGSEFQTKNFDYNAVHYKGAKEIAKACKEFDVERLIHFSALNVTQPAEKHYFKKIQFLPSKLKGEEAVLNEFPKATIFRPSNIFGQGDRFIWPICEKIRIFHPISASIPLYAKGEKTIKQPVYASDVALGVLNAINDYDTRGKIYQIVGPERFYLKDIATFCAQILQRHFFKDSLIHDMKYDLFFFTKLMILEQTVNRLMHYPRYDINFEHIEIESQTDVVDPQLPTLEDLGVSLSKLEDKMPTFILQKFFKGYSKWMNYHDFLPADSLSAKALSSFKIRPELN